MCFYCILGFSSDFLFLLLGKSFDITLTRQENITENNNTTLHWVRNSLNVDFICFVCQFVIFVLDSQACLNNDS